MSLRKMMSGRGPRPAMSHKKKKIPKKARIVMKEFGKGGLHSGSKHGPIVTDPDQAFAIADSEARKVGQKMPRRKKT